MSARQKKAIDDHCTSEWAASVGGPWGEFEDAGIDKVKAEPGQEVYKLTPAQSRNGRRRPSRSRKSWADGVKKAGIDPELAMKGLRAELVKNKAAY